MVFSGHLATQTPIFELILRMGLALIFGGIIGIERELKHHAAGLRTNMMVALAAATFTLLAAELISESAQQTGLIRIDPLRLMNAVITGVAFLGAGAIIRGGDGVKGLTTGASLWMTGAIGVACGGGYYVIAVLATVFAVVVLYVISLLERRFRGQKRD